VVEIQKLGRAGNILHRREAGDFQEAGRLSRTEDRTTSGLADGCQMDPDLMRASRIRLTSNVVVPGVLLDAVLLGAVPFGAAEITFANDRDGLPTWAGGPHRTDARVRTRPMGVRIS